MKGRTGYKKGGSSNCGVMPAKSMPMRKGGKIAPLDGEVAHKRVDRILRTGSGKPSNVAGNAYKASEGPGVKPNKR